jgi:hypothetical protein
MTRVRLSAWLLATMMCIPAAGARTRRKGPPPHATVGDLWSDKSAAAPIVADVGEPETDPKPPAELDPEMLAAKATLIDVGEKMLLTMFEADAKKAVEVITNEVPVWEQRCCQGGLTCDFAKGEVNGAKEEDAPRAEACANEFNATIMPSVELVRDIQADPVTALKKREKEMIARDPELERITRGIAQIEQIEQERRRAMDAYRAKAALARASASWHKCSGDGDLRKRKHCLDQVFDGVSADLPDREDSLPPDPSRYYFGGGQ